VNVADLVGFDGILNQVNSLPEMVSKRDLVPIFQELISRMELFKRGVISQLAATPTIFYANPTLEPDLVAGAKLGDVAFFRVGGVDQYQILG